MTPAIRSSAAERVTLRLISDETLRTSSSSRPLSRQKVGVPAKPSTAEASLMELSVYWASVGMAGFKKWTDTPQTSSASS